MKYLFPLSPYNQQRQFEKPVWVYPAHLAAYATYLRDEGHEVIWDWKSPPKRTNGPIQVSFAGGPDALSIFDDTDIDVPFEKLPYPDRNFTDAKNPRWQKYGNYRRHPATHMMASNLCWYAGKNGCTFCIDSKKIVEGEPRQTRSVSHVIEEIDDLISNGYREVFDDSGSFPVGKWLEEFCQKMNQKGPNGRPRNKDIIIGCNMKLVRLDYKMMANAGFRFILVGVESANQKTLDMIQKGQKSEDIIPILKSMSDAGLYPHTTWMSNFPNESFEDELNSIKLCNYLLKKGYAKTAQASIYCSPRTAPNPNKGDHKRIPMYFNAFKYPEFWFNKVKDLKDWDDFKYLARGGRLIIEEYWRKIWKR